MENNINTQLNWLLVPQKIEIFSLALHLGIFRLIEEKINTLQKVVEKINANSENTKIFLETLIYLNFLKEKKGVYENTPFTKKFFVNGSDSYCGDIFLYRKALLDSAKKIFKSLLMDGNEKFKNSKHPEKWAQAAKTNLKQEQKVLVAPFAIDIIKKLPEYNSLKKVLDLGCSSAIVGLELIKEHKKAKGICFDYEEVIQVADTHIKEYDLEDRVNTISGDIELDDIKDGYDLIWCSNIFYFIQNKKQLIEKLYKSLNKGGILVSTHIELDENNCMDEASYFYYLFLKLQGREHLKTKELKEFFKDSGFNSIDTHKSFDFPMTPMQVHVVRK